MDSFKIHLLYFIPADQYNKIVIYFKEVMLEEMYLLLNTKYLKIISLFANTNNLNMLIT